MCKKNEIKRQQMCQCLHSVPLNFLDPKTSERTFTVATPADFRLFRDADPGLRAETWCSA